MRVVIPRCELLVGSLLLWLFHVPVALAGGILALDYGTDSFKAALVKPGHFDVVLSKDSKRKSPSIVVLRGDDKLVGADAAAAAIRFPRDAVSAVKLLLGNHQDQVALHDSLYGLRHTALGQAPCSVTLSDGASYRLEELLAMQFAHAAEMAKATAHEKISDAIVTVPAFFDHAQRRAVLDAMDLAGLKPLGLINDGTAVAINYALPRTFSSDPEVHVFLDAGASATRATVASFSSILASSGTSSITSRNATGIEILGVGWDQVSGGAVLDAKLRDILQAAFEQKSGHRLAQPVGENPRALAKLLREASRIKHILSANAQAQARIENLAEDIDFSCAVERSQLETECAVLQAHFAQPISDALRMANIAIDQITSVVLVGGHSRVPMVQAAIRGIVPDDKIAQNLNADEAAVMGAALHGAILNRQFRTKDIRTSDISLERFLLSHTARSATYNSLEPLFADGASLGASRIITFEADQNFTVSVTAQSESSQSKQRQTLFTAIVGGIDAALNGTGDGESVLLVDVELQVDGEGLVQMLSATRQRPAADQKASSKAEAGKLFGGFFGGTKSSESAAAENAPPVQSENSTAGAAAPQIVNLPFSIDASAMSKADKLLAKKRLRDMEQAETRKRTREEARNQLESFIYRLRDSLASEEGKSYSTGEERGRLDEVASTAADWLYEHAETAPTKDLRQKRNELEKLWKPIQSRMAEDKDRPSAVTEFQIALFQGRAFHMSASANATAAKEDGDELPRHTVEELDALQTMLEDASAWFESLQARQSQLHASDDPVLRTADLNRKANGILREVGKLTKKPKPRKPRNATSGASGTAAPTKAEAPSNDDATTPLRPGDEL